MMGGEQAADVIVTVKNAQLARAGKELLAKRPPFPFPLVHVFVDANFVEVRFLPR